MSTLPVRHAAGATTTHAIGSGLSDELRSRSAVPATATFLPA